MVKYAIATKEEISQYPFIESCLDLAIVVCASTLEGNTVPSTANEFFEAATSFIGRKMDDFGGQNLDENRLKFALAKSPGMKYLQSQLYIQVRDISCKLPGSVCPPLVTNGKQMTILKNSNLSYEKYTNDHYEAIWKLENKLRAHCIATAHEMTKKRKVVTPQEASPPLPRSSSLRMRPNAPSFPLFGRLHIRRPLQTRSQGQVKPAEVPNDTEEVLTTEREKKHVDYVKVKLEQESNKYLKAVRDGKLTDMQHRIRDHLPLTFDLKYHNACSTNFLKQNRLISQHLKTAEEDHVGAKRLFDRCFIAANQQAETRLVSN
jgi:hypothetical protein